MAAKLYTCSNCTFWEEDAYAIHTRGICSPPLGFKQPTDSGEGCYQWEAKVASSHNYKVCSNCNSWKAKDKGYGKCIRNPHGKETFYNNNCPCWGRRSKNVAAEISPHKDPCCYCRRWVPFSNKSFIIGNEIPQGTCVQFFKVTKCNQTCNFFKYVTQHLYAKRVNQHFPV